MNKKGVIFEYEYAIPIRNLFFLNFYEIEYIY